MEGEGRRQEESERTKEGGGVTHVSWIVPSPLPSPFLDKRRPGDGGDSAPYKALDRRIPEPCRNSTRNAKVLYVFSLVGPPNHTW